MPCEVVDHAKEWLVQRMFLMDAQGEVACLFVEPKLMLDKTSWSHFEAQTQFCSMARESHRQAVTISHHIWDRAVVEPCGRHARSRHAAYDLFLEEEVGEEEAFFGFVEVLGDSRGMCLS